MEEVGTVEIEETQSAPQEALPAAQDNHDDAPSDPNGGNLPQEETTPPMERPPPLKLAPLVVILFYLVSGGPYGTEETVKAAGPFYTLLFCFLTPFIWSLQESQIMAELTCAMPDASGGVVWCETAFGPFAGWLEGTLSNISGMTDNAIYPVLFLDYLIKVLPEGAKEQEHLHPVYRFFLLAFLAVCLSYLNWRGLNLVGNMSIVICIVAMSPFVVMAILAADKIDPARWMVGPSLTAEDYKAISTYDLSGGFFPNATLGGVLLRPFLNNLFWNYNSFDSVGSLSEEVGDSPERIIPRALSWTWFITIFGYLIPLLVAIGASESSQADWEDGYLAQVAHDVVGPWLADWMVFAAFLSNLALFQAELSSDAFSLYGMANKGMLPSALGVRSRHGTPTSAIVFCTIIIIIFSVAHLDQLVEMLNFNYAISLLMEYAAFIKLRIYHPDLPRPYRVPLSTRWCIFFMIPTVGATLMVMAVASYMTLLVGFFSVLLASALYIIFGKQIRENSTTYTEVNQEQSNDLIEIT
ncbi:Probable polyamine transporter [Seminavis robusta]|uniref:Probable polyamine transporter n=1 Tax=Seminavis robusta TaxID=568900 RepID=A0A9N8DLZ2_9STRA|nr:Probable polyamine transporter [Seminavis robusta]|eukprot:Sro129_g061510.1 Probable polyamine transporter (525) ;mRNA; f:37146-39242